MATNIRILHNVLSDASSTTFSTNTPTDATEFPGSNVVSEIVNEVARLDDDTESFIKVDFGSAVQCTQLYVGPHNLTTSASVDLYGHTSNLGDTEGAWSGTATTVSSPTNNNTGGGASAGSFLSHQNISSGAGEDDLPARFKNINAFFNGTFRWWFLSLKDSSNPDDYIEVGRFILGRYVEPTRFILRNFSADLQDFSERIRLEGSIQEIVNVKPRAHVYTFTFKNLTTADLANHKELFLNIGNNNHAVFTPHVEDDLNEVIYGKIIGNMSITKKVGDYYDVSWRVQEAA